MKEGQPRQVKQNEQNHRDNMSLADHTIYKGRYFLHGEAQIPLTQEQKKIRRQQRGR